MAKKKDTPAPEPMMVSKDFAELLSDTISDVALPEHTLVIYHGNCADGFGAAWAVRAAGFPVEFHAATYGEAPPDVTGRRVIIVDFSYRREIMTKIIEDAESVIVLDHHKTAQADLEGLDQGPGSRVHVVFDMTKSGAMLAWEHFHPGKPAPNLLRHIQDRDLWKFELVGTREVSSALFSYPYVFEVWDRLVDEMENGVYTLVSDGAAIDRKHFKDIAELRSKTERHMIIGGYLVPVANMPYTMSSDAANQMAQDQPFAACYMDGPDGRYFSLRSTAGGVDVSQIAWAYGGGGHARAAGFTAAIGWEGEVGGIKHPWPPAIPPAQETAGF